MTMGDRLRELRLARGESLQKAATPVGCSKPHLWELERGITDNPTLDLLRRLAQHYGVTVSYLIDGAP
jgi:transcriptional regulator with XRE-family HTH domain